MSTDLMTVRFKAPGHVPQTGTSYDPGSVAEVPHAWAIDELGKQTIEPATAADLAEFQKPEKPEKPEKKPKE
jgi:hypothetical protein